MLEELASVHSSGSPCQTDSWLWSLSVIVSEIINLRYDVSMIAEYFFVP